MPLVSLAAFAGCQLLATDYYVGRNGSDTNPGTSQAKAWQTIARANMQKFVAGRPAPVRGRRDLHRHPGAHRRRRGIVGQARRRRFVGHGEGGPRRRRTGDGILAENVGLTSTSASSRSGAMARSRIAAAASLSVIRCPTASGWRACALRVWRPWLLVRRHPGRGPAPRQDAERLPQRRDLRFGSLRQRLLRHLRQRREHRQAGLRAPECPGLWAARCTTIPAIRRSSATTAATASCSTMWTAASSSIASPTATAPPTASENGGPVGIWAHSVEQSRDPVLRVVRESHRRRADGGGFDLDGGVTNSIMQYNYSHDNDGAGYLVWNYEDAPHELRGNTVRFNVSKNDGRKHDYGGIHIGTSDKPVRDLLVYNNTVLVSPCAPRLSRAASGSAESQARASASSTTSW